VRRKFKITKKKLKREKREEVKKKRMEGGQNERRGKKEDKEVIYIFTSFQLTSTWYVFLVAVGL
jgi:hypothetical protein